MVTIIDHSGNPVTVSSINDTVNLSGQYNSTVTISSQGIQGPAGPPGTGGGGAESEVHEFLTPALTWTVTHNLTFRPSVTLVDINGIIFYGDVDYVNDTTILITHSAAIAGTVYLS